MMLSVWTDGLPSNLLSEFVGLIASIVATYLILDRLIERNRKRHFEPLKRSLYRAAGQNLAAITHLWAFTMGKANSHDLEEALEHDLGEVIEDLARRIEAEMQRLEGSAEARAEFAARTGGRIEQIARETFEDITGIGEVANRVAQVVYDDIELERRLADLSADARALDHVRSFAEYLDNAPANAGASRAGDAPIDLLMVLSLRCYRGARDVWNYLESLEDSHDSKGKR